MKEKLPAAAAPEIPDDEPAYRTYRYTGTEPVDFTTLGWSPEKPGDQLTLFGPRIQAHNLEQVSVSRDLPTTKGAE